MYNQSFSGKELYRLTTQLERRNFGMEKDAFIKAIDDEISSAMIDRTYSFEIRNINGLFLNGRSRTTLDEKFSYLCQDLVLRKVYQNVKRIYKIRQSDRNAIIRQIQLLLSCNKDFWIIRLDIKSFYESLDKENILDRLYKQYRLSPITVFLLQKLFDSPDIKSSSGVPRGLSVSSCLSELAMKYFDIEVKQLSGVYYYARFVDDIIVFCATEESMNKTWDFIPKKLQELSLVLNTAKSYRVSSTELKNMDGEKLVYLGYSFSFKKKNVMKKCKEDSEWTLHTDIAPSKVDKIKTRIVKAFVNVAKNGDVGLLVDRIKYLTGNYSIKSSTTLLPIKAGVFYNYKLISDESLSLNELDVFYQNILHCYRGKLGLRLSKVLSKSDREVLTKYSFRYGFKNRTFHGLTFDRIHRIKMCWL